jgi:2',3'-cyclic-nucleotide 2'-phosphodiesterase (5'-nucleotidase family)
VPIRKYNFLLFLSLLLLLQFSSCRSNSGLQYSKTQRGVISIDSIVITKPDSLSLEIIEPYKAELENKINEILAYSERSLSKQQPEGLLNNFVADLVLKKSADYYKFIDSAKIDICLLNYGGLRNPLPKGAITIGNVYELMPFENMVSVLTISGINTKKMFNYIATKNGMPVSGVKVGINNGKAVDILINNSPIDTSRNYRIATSDYLADGGDNMDFFLNPIKKTSLGIKLRDMIVEYLKEETSQGRTINVSLDKRIYYAK